MGTGKIHHGSTKEHPLHGPDASEWDVYWPSIEEPYLTFNGTVPKMAPEMGNLVYGVGDTPEEDCGDYQHATWAVSRLSQEYDRPFFLGVGLYKPHLPFVCPKAYFDLYDPEKLQGVLVKEDDLSDIPDAGRYLVNQHLNDYIVAHHMQKDILHAYLACVSYMDAQVGRILDALENSPHKDNTVVIFCGDNGWHFGEKHTWKKFTLWKEATRVPLILSCPGKGRDRFCSKPVGLMDIFPTVQEICGLSDTKQKLEGRSLVLLLEDPEIPWEVPVITSHGRDSYSMTTERWKYIRYFDGTEELYDRLDDGYEWNNLADKESSMRIKKELQPYIPSTSAANAPGSTHPNYFVTDYPNLQAWRKRQEEKK